MEPAPPPAHARITAAPPPPQRNPVKLEPPRDFAARLSRAWPRSAQWATAVLLSGVLVLLGIQIGRSNRDGPANSEHEVLLDANQATRAELMQVPGVGPALADRIVAYRKASGPFRDVQDLRRVPGVGPATWQRLRDYVFVEPPPASAAAQGQPAEPEAPPGSAAKAKAPGKSKKEEALAGQRINVNQAGATDLQKLPGIGPKLSQRILDERAKRPFASVSELRRVPGIGPKTLEKIRPYVVTDDAEPIARVK